VSVPRAQGGFTLLELMVAITVTVMVAGAAVAIIANITSVRQRVRQQMAIRQEARAAVQSLASTLRNLYRGPNGKAGAFEGMDDWADDLPADRIRFFAVSRRPIRPGQPESDVREFEFQMIPARGDEPPALIRRTDPTRNPDPDGGGILERIAENVVGLNFTYHDGARWRDEWQGEQAPQTVRIDLFLAAADNSQPLAVSHLVNFPHRARERRRQPD
jgi:prepilin-type N-terminal cleavage/methylation domain-containing protein